MKNKIFKIHDYYGSWKKVKQFSVKDPQTGIWEIITPQPFKSKIYSGPEPNQKSNPFTWLFGKFSPYRKK